MAIREFIETHRAFTLEELRRECGGTRTNANLLSRACMAGKVSMARRGLYVSNVCRMQYAEPLHLELASKAFPGCAFCHSTAFELLLGSQDVVREVHACSASLRAAFSFGGYAFECSPCDMGAKRLREVPTRHGRTYLATTLEQTVVDALERPQRNQGVEGVLRRISTAGPVDVGELVELAEGRSKSVCARLGWVLEQKRDAWGVEESDLRRLRERAAGGPWFMPAHRKGRVLHYSGEWNLAFYETEATLMEWIDG